MKISVIIPTYKPQDYIWECLNSLTKQTFSKKKFEVIIVLNGCCEPWKTDLETFISTKMKEMNVRFIQTNQVGVSNARNIALDVSKGEYITFVDDDDFVSPSFLEELYEKSTPDTVALSYAYAFNDGNISEKLKYRITSEFEKRNKYGKQPYKKTRKIFSGPCMKLFHKNIIGNRRFNPHFKNGEDSLFMFLISDRLKYVEYTSHEAIYYRRIRENSAVTKNRPIIQIIFNGLNLMKCYTYIYLRSPFKYSFNFYFSRILGTIKGIIFSIKMKNRSFYGAV